MTNTHHSEKRYVLLVLSVVASVAVLVSANTIKSKDETLLKAIDNDDLQAVQKLLEKHPELVNTMIHRKGKQNDIYPLNYAISKKHKEIAEFLIIKGADPDAAAGTALGV